MLSLKHILKAQAQNAAYGDTGRHYFAGGPVGGERHHFGDASMPAPAVTAPKHTGPKEGLWREWDEATCSYSRVVYSAGVVVDFDGEWQKPRPRVVPVRNPQTGKINMVETDRPARPR